MAKKQSGYLNSYPTYTDTPRWWSESLTAPLSEYTTEQRTLVDLRNYVQKVRIGFEGRARAVEYGWDTADEFSIEFSNYWTERFGALEKDMDKTIVNHAKQYKINHYLNGLRGIGWLTAAQITSRCDIRRSHFYTQLLRYWGLGCDEKGRAEVKRPGRKLGYPPENKRQTFVIADSLMKARSPYLQLYTMAKKRYDEKRPRWSNKHRVNAARRRMMHIFFQHLWVVWRDLEGLPINRPWMMWKWEKFYPRYYIPEKYGWRIPHIMDKLREVHPGSYEDYEDQRNT
jgi:hypothetical protein